MWKRVFAALGSAWIVGVVGFLLFGTNAPVLWKIAWAEYGGVGLVHMIGVWRGKDRDETWNRRMWWIQSGGFVIASGLFLIGALMASR